LLLLLLVFTHLENDVGVDLDLIISIGTRDNLEASWRHRKKEPRLVTISVNLACHLLSLRPLAHHEGQTLHSQFSTLLIPGRCIPPRLAYQALSSLRTPSYLTQ
jgi:hypothetical protein